MVRFPSGLDITVTHPIFDARKGWVFPRDVRTPGVKTESVECDEVFNILLDSHYTAIVNGTLCALLGHDRGGQTRHEFWGNWKLVAGCLKIVDAEGYRLGNIQIRRQLRDPVTKRVYGFEGMDGKIGSYKDIQQSEE